MDIITVMTGLRENEAIMQSGPIQECVMGEKYDGNGPGEFEDVLSASYREDKEYKTTVKNSPAKDSGPEKVSPKEVSPKRKIRDLAECKYENVEICFEWGEDTGKEILSIPLLPKAAEKLERIFATGSNDHNIFGLAAKIKTALGKKVMEEVLKEMDPLLLEWKKTGLSGKTLKDSKMADLAPIFTRAVLKVLDSLEPGKTESMSLLAGIKKPLIMEHKPVNGGVENGLKDPGNSLEPLIEKAVGEFTDGPYLKLAGIKKPLIMEHKSVEGIKKPLIAEHKPVNGGVENGLKDPGNSLEPLIEKAVGEFMDDLCLKLARVIKSAGSSANSSRKNGSAEKGPVTAVAIGKDDILLKTASKNQISLSDPDKNKNGPGRQFDGISKATGEISLLRSGKSDLSVGRFNTNIKPEEIAFQITKHIDPGREGSVKEIEVRLNPESLGTIKIRVLSQDNKVTIFIKTHYVHTNEIIHESIEGLRHNLIEKGLEIKELSVSADPNDFSNKDNGKNSPAYRQSRASGNWIKENDMTAGETEESALLRENYTGRTAEYGYLNIIV